MDTLLFQILVAVCGALGGFFIKVIWDSVKELQEADRELTDRVHEVEKLIAGDYVRRDYLDGKIDAIFVKLDKIEDKVDRKVDK